MENQSNVDKAKQCIKKAKVALANENFQKSEEYLLRAQSLDPSSYAKKLLERVRAAGRQENRPSTESEAPTRSRKRPMSTTSAVQLQNRPKPTRQRAEEVPNRETFEQPPTVDYTEDQLNIVNRILKCKNYYEILGVSKDANKEDIVKAYRKLALLVHTDKNRAPRAKEAFQMVGNAVMTLTDEVKRIEYDMREEYDTCTDCTRGFEANVAAEEVFCMFFGTLGLVAAGGYAGYKLGSALSRNEQTEENERSEPRKLNAAEVIGGVAGVMVAIFAGSALLNALHK